MSEQAELLPCPFCGGDELAHGWSSPGMDGSMHTGSVECHSCNAMVYAGTEAEAIAAWNRRATPKSSEGELLRALQTIASIIGNVDHSRGGGANAASMYGEMLNDIRAIAHDAAAKAGATHA